MFDSWYPGAPLFPKQLERWWLSAYVRRASWIDPRTSISPSSTNARGSSLYESLYSESPRIRPVCPLTYSNQGYHNAYTRPLFRVLEAYEGRYDFSRPLPELLKIFSECHRGISFFNIPNDDNTNSSVADLGLRSPYGLPLPLGHRLSHYRLISWFDVKSLERLFEAYGYGLAYQVRNLKATCKQLSDLLAGHHFSPAVRNRVEDLHKDIKRSTLVEKAQLRGDRKFPRLYLNFFVKPGEATGAPILDLRKVRDLAAVIQERHKAATAKGFREGVGSAEKCQQIYDKAEKIERSLGTICETLNRSVRYWEPEGVNKSFKNASSPLPGQQAKDPPDAVVSTEGVNQKNAILGIF
ncbi:hypothetical protein B0H13DRAFT_2336112 [Mycena leptocephala]|nr:hypothetical protein B0H13DRAFT_2336112 [Mycena leptocephala]